MNIKPNLENLSEEDFYKLLIKMAKSIDKDIIETTENLKDSFDWDYWQGQDKLRDFYTKYNLDYDSQLN